MDYQSSIFRLNDKAKLIKLCPHGVTTRRGSSRLVSPGEFSSRSPRGSITGFSRHSSLRLRRALCELSPVGKGGAGYSSVGITLTLPWRLPDDFDPDLVHADYKIAFNRFSVSFRRRFPNSAAIFRHEIQQRGAPHNHIVCYFSDLDFKLVARGRSANLSDLRAIVFSFWSHALDGFDYQVNIPAFVKRGVKLDPLADNIAMYRYIADHSSKHKLCQLGYKGKQWGFINRKLFVPVDSGLISFSDPDVRMLFYRHVSKLCRYTVPHCDSLFGSRLSRRCDGRSVYFLDRETSERLFFAIAYGRITPGFQLQHYYNSLSFWLWFFSVFCPLC